MEAYHRLGGDPNISVVGQLMGGAHAWGKLPGGSRERCVARARVLIPNGVAVGEGSVVGAGSVVGRDLQPHVVVYGNSGRAQRPLFLPSDLEKHIAIAGSLMEANPRLVRWQKHGIDDHL